MEWGDHHSQEEAAAEAVRQPLRCGLLLQLPGDLEPAFWRDPHTLRSYAAADMLAGGYTLLGNLMVARAVSLHGTASSRATPGIALWVHVTLALNILACILTLTCLLCHPKVYLKHRHKAATANRLLRFACLLVMCFGNTPSNQAALASSLRLTPEGSGKPEAVVALLNMCRPLFLTGLIVQGGGDWAIKVKWWLPLQVLTLLLSCHGWLRFQPYSLASDRYIAAILQQTCSGISRLHQTVLGIVVGQHLIGPLGLAAESSVCGDLLLASRVVAWYSQAAYVLLISGGIFVHLEARLKAQWVARHSGKRLVYGPLAWPCGSSERGWGCNPLAKAVEWIVLVPAAFAQLWVFCLWLVPKLPSQPLDTALCGGNAPGTCPALAPCEGMLCQDPGLAAALLLYVEMLTVLAVKGFLLHSVVDLVRCAPS